MRTAEGDLTTVVIVKHSDKGKELPHHKGALSGIASYGIEPQNKR
jgi:hypothetical protein